MFGKLTLDALKHNSIENLAGVLMTIMMVGAIGTITYFKKWTFIWKEWVTSLDPKKIGSMYIIVSFLMLIKGAIDGIMMRLQQVMSVGESYGYLTSSHFQQIFTVHGTTMIFFVGMGVVFGLLNLVVPLQIGARDVAFPFLNSVGFWLFAVAAFLVNLSLVVGQFSGAGWLAYPPLSSPEYNPGVGVDYWIWTLQVAGVGSLISGVNFLVTIFKMRCPGMTMMKMPLFIWCALGCLVLICFAFPILTASLAMLSLDRLLGMHFFSASYGGNPMMFINLIWAWGHPEVYILILPAFGVFSEVVATFSQKRLFGYTSMVWAIIAITFLSFIVWLHHFFTMGAGANVNAFFGIMTMIIAVPTGVKIFNWLFTQYRGRVRFTSPMLWFMGFCVSFSVGGVAGVLMSVPAVDYQVHNSLFLIAHFHSMILPGVLFGFFAAFSYWFPKITGFTLHESTGKYSVFFWTLGFLVAFMPLYLLGLMGATRRLDHYAAGNGWHPWFVMAGIGVILISIGIGFQVAQLVISFKRRHQEQDVTGDPWNGRTLEWSIASPPPVYNFAVLPHVEHHDSFWMQKESGEAFKTPSSYEAIHIPKNSAMGLFIGLFAGAFAFTITWQMMELALLSFLGVVTLLIIRLCHDDIEYTLSPEEVEKIEKESRRKRS